MTVRVATLAGLALVLGTILTRACVDIIDGTTEGDPAVANQPTSASTDATGTPMP